MGKCLAVSKSVVYLCSQYDKQQKNSKMKKIKSEILKKLKAIEKAAILTSMEGKVSFYVSGKIMGEFDAAIEDITEYPRYKHTV